MSAATAVQPVTITEPGVYEISHADYHADPVPGGSLSSTGARRLLPPSCPARFRWEQDNPPEPAASLDTGSAAHDTLLGGGPEIVVIPDEITAKDGNWSTAKAKAMVEEVRARGAVPVKPAVWAEVEAMVASVRAHPIAGRLFEPGSGQPEASLFWQDEPTGIWRRARLDWLPDRRGRRLIVPDLKTCLSAHRDKFVKSAADYGYHQQAPYYLDGIRALGLDDDPAFVFVAVEKRPPYLVNVIQLDVTAMRIGAALNRQAIEIFAECQRTGEWPGYSKDIELASLPAWYERAHEQDLMP